MILLRLFWEFFKVGLFTFGGGYGAISLIYEAVEKSPWMNMSEDMVTYIVGVAESTPGPIMVNSATYIGTTVAGPLGAIFATCGVVLPSFIIILIIARFLSGFLEKEVSRKVLDTIKPCVIGIILGTGFYFLLSGVIPQINSLFSDGFTSALVPTFRVGLIFALVFLLRTGYRLWKKKVIPPVLSIAVSAVLGILIFGV